MRLLLVEDDAALSDLIVSMLESEKFECDHVATLEKARARVKQGGYDAIILDVILPDGDGVNFCRRLRIDGEQTPILVLTSKGSTVDMVSGLDAGADDYMPKPFSPNELKARLRALLRRPQQAVSESISCGDIEINVLSHSVTKAGVPVSLMPKEYSLLEHLMRKKNQVVKRDELLRHVWGIYSKTSSNRLEVYIRYLREKLDLPYDTNVIQTVRGLGYKVADE